MSSPRCLMLAHRHGPDAVEKLKLKLGSVNDSDLKRQFILESIINTVGNRLQREFTVMSPADPMFALWHHSPNPIRAMKQAKRHLLRNPPFEDLASFKDLGALFSLVKMALRTLLVYDLVYAIETTLPVWINPAERTDSQFVSQPGSTWFTSWVVGPNQWKAGLTFCPSTSLKIDGEFQGSFYTSGYLNIEISQLRTRLTLDICPFSELYDSNTTKTLYKALASSTTPKNRTDFGPAVLCENVILARKG
ncbi:hypothetical protein SISSUDRAFT_1036773 [Sistotremastrum suecicum HHB10207 ss-3]|uniref:Uncharacterized protein n=1 Tax=Sistotremastrum suecicum HHB10207 ss-3 TaxID=1314776 RepID=A0A165Z0R0_9AGAM|nr:hypothetical protein SISSUDRAFT_1036773 [Sistotremastrum suecicum HHB10207 ss-3]